jgi:hypothetical protein
MDLLDRWFHRLNRGLDHPRNRDRIHRQPDRAGMGHLLLASANCRIECRVRSSAAPPPDDLEWVRERIDASAADHVTLRSLPYQLGDAVG